MRATVDLLLSGEGDIQRHSRGRGRGSMAFVRVDFAYLPDAVHWWFCRDQKGPGSLADEGAVLQEEAEQERGMLATSHMPLELYPRRSYYLG